MTTIRSADGKTFEFPDDIPPDVMEELIRNTYAPQPPPATAVPNNPATVAERALAQGAETFKSHYQDYNENIARQEYANESGIKTFVRPIVNGAMLGMLPNFIARRNQLLGESAPDVSPVDRREIERRKLEMTATDHPYGSFVGGMAGGAASLAGGAEMIPTASMAGRGLAAAGRALESVPTWFGRTLATGAAVGAPLAAVGELGEENPTIGGAIERGAEGAALGGLFNVGAQGAGLGAVAGYRAARSLGDRYAWPEQGGQVAGQRDVARLFERARIDPADVARIQQEQTNLGRAPLNMLEAAHEAGELQTPPRPAAAYSLLNAARAAAVKGEEGAGAAATINENIINQPGRLAQLFQNENLAAGKTFNSEKDRIIDAITRQAGVDYGKVRATEQRAISQGKKDKLANSLQTVLDDAETKFEDTLTMNTPEAGVVKRAINRFKLKQSPASAQKQADVVSTLGDEVERLTGVANQAYDNLVNSGKMDAKTYKSIAPLKKAADDLNEVSGKLSSFEGAIPKGMLNKLQEIADTAREAGVSSGPLESALDNLRKLRQETLQRPKPVRTVQQFIDARRALRDDIVASRNDDGSPSRVTGQLREFYRNLNSAAHNVFPQLKTADATHAEARSADEFLNEGRNIAMRAGPAQDEALAKFKTATPDQQELMRMGFKQHLIDMVLNTNYESTATPNKFMANNVQRLLGKLFPADRAESLYTGLRREYFKSKVARGLFEGSRTAPMHEQMLQLMLEPRLAAHAVRGNIPGIISMADRMLADKFATIRSEQQMREFMKTNPDAMQGIIDAGQKQSYPDMSNAVYMAAPTAAGLTGDR